MRSFINYSLTRLFILAGAILFMSSTAYAFCPGKTYSSPFEKYNSYCRLVEDLNGDRIPDVVFVGAAHVFVLFGQGGGKYSEPITALSYADRSYEGYEVRLEDRNGDSVPDLAFIGPVNYFAHAGSTTGSFAQQRFDLPCNEAFLSRSGLACKYVTTKLPVDSSLSGKNIFNLPAEVMIRAWSKVPGVGWVIERAWAQDPYNRAVNIATLKPPPDYANYMYCDTNVIYHAINPQGGPHRVRHGWTYHGKDFGTFAWKLSRKDLFEGGTSFKADIYWFAVHPEYASRAVSQGVCGTPRGNLKAPF